MLLRASPHEPPPARAQRHRPAARASPVRRVRAVAAPPQLDATTGAARFGPGGAVHIDEGIIARYASFVDGARPPPVLSTPPRPPPPTPMPLSTLAPRPAAVSTTPRTTNPRAPSTPGTKRPTTAPSPPASPQTLHRPVPGRSPIDDQDERESNADDNDGDDVFDGAGPQGQRDRVAVCVLALVLALVVGRWRSART